jgi:2-oxoacid:acceptor oxidoreductase delta subunit (pyruvate/2-ketoisovalerate family)
MKMKQELKPQEKSSFLRINKPFIISDKCTKCRLCIASCPHDCIRIGKKEYPVIDYDICTGCLICFRICPFNAIGEERNEG